MTGFNRLPTRQWRRLLSGPTTGYIPANTRRWSSVGLMLAHRRRRWANVKSTLCERLLFPGIISRPNPFCMHYATPLWCRVKPNGSNSSLLNWAVTVFRLCMHSSALCHYHTSCGEWIANTWVSQRNNYFSRPNKILNLRKLSILKIGKTQLLARLLISVD